MKLINHGIGYYSKSQGIGPIRWNFYDLVFVESGSIDFEIENAIHSLVGCGILILHPKTNCRGVVTSKSASIWVCHFSAQKNALLLYPNLFSSGKYQMSPCTESLLSKCLRAKITCLFKDSSSSDLQSSLRVFFRAFLAELDHIMKLVRQPHSEKSHCLHLAMTWAKENIENTLSVSDMAKIADLSPSRFRACFFQEFGFTPKQALLNIQLEHAAYLLNHTNKPIKEISALCNYSNHSAFYAAFQKRYSITPQRYRLDTSGWL